MHHNQRVSLSPSTSSVNTILEENLEVLQSDYELLKRQLEQSEAKVIQVEEALKQ